MTATADPTMTDALPLGAGENPYVRVTPKAAAPVEGPRAPRIEQWVDIPDYPGYRAKVWVNFPQRLFGEITSGDQGVGAAALSRIVVEHNGWRDEDGAAYPPPSDAAFWDAIPLHLAVRVMQAIQRQAVEAPLAPARKPNSAPT